MNTITVGYVIPNHCQCKPLTDAVKERIIQFFKVKGKTVEFLQLPDMCK